MQRTGEWFTQEALPYDGRKDAKNLRIRGLEPLVTNRALHIMASMKSLIEELEMYPHSKTKDILDCLGYLMMIAKKQDKAQVIHTIDPFSIEAIEKELHEKANESRNNLPFDVQLRSFRDVSETYN